MKEVAVTATLPAGKKLLGEIRIRSLRNDSLDCFVEIGVWYGEKPSDRVIFPLSLVPHVLRGIKDAKDAGWAELKKARGE